MPVDSAFPLIEELQVARLVGPLALSRGRTILKAGAVGDLAWDTSRFRLTADVQGTEPRPYHVLITLDLGRSDRVSVLGAGCSCPVSLNCKHVAAVLLASSERHVEERRQADAARSAPAGPVVADWRTEIAKLAGGERTSAPAATAPLALQFELRERVSRRPDRWQGPRDTTAVSEASVDRLAVRPVTRGARGGWIKGSLTWQNVGFQGAANGFDPIQARWFAEFSALKGARHSGFSDYGSAWISMDEFESPTLWALLAQAASLGIEFVGPTPKSTVSIASRATIGLDATRDADGDGDDDRGDGGRADGDGNGGRGDGADLLLVTSVRIDDAAVAGDRARLIGTHGVYAFDFAQGTIVLAPLGGRLTEAQRAAVTRREPVRIPAADVESFVDDHYPALARSLRVESRDESFELPPLAPATLVLTATHEPNHVMRVEWAWQRDGGGRLPIDAPDVEFHDPDGERAVAAHAAAILADDAAGAPLLTRDDPRRLRTGVSLRGLEAAEFSTRLLPRLADLDRLRVEVGGEAPAYRELVEAPKLTVTAVESEQTDWFDLGVVVTVEGKKVPFGPLFTALSHGRKKLLLVDGSYLSLAHPVFEPLRELLDEAGSLREWETGVAIHRTQASLWSEFEDLADETESAVSWRETVAGLNNPGGIDPVPPPAGLALELRPYQLEGFRWLAFLHRHGLGGILADDMGLGKTAQTLALVAHAIEQSDVPPPPFLVVAPTSVVSNWSAEAERFVPGLRVTTIGATQAASGRRIADLAAGADIVVTSYAILRLDAAAFAALDWAGLVLDEAQFVKNGASKANAAARDIRAPFRLAVTGTPVENNLMELWALMKIVAPGLFPSARAFAERYRRPIENDHNIERLGRLRRRIRPLVLRRTKELVAPELPEKQEQVLSVELDPRHRRIYDTFLQRERQKLLGLIDDLDRNRFTVFRSLTLLRMLSLSPALIDPEQYAEVPSAKLDALFEQLDEVIAEGHRALVFSQFTSFLQLAAARLDAAGVPYTYLDGSTRRRSEVIDRFRDGTAPVFLISLKAGGFGLNLTEADYVFLLDPWWNPASEAQAVDRAHRIGQAKTVMVYRMVAEGTIEEKVMALKSKKAALVSSLMDDDDLFSESLSADDIRGLIEG